MTVSHLGNRGQCHTDESPTDFAFYVNKNGWRSRKDFMVHWEGSPTGFGEGDGNVIN